MAAKAVPGATLRLRRRLALVIGIGDYENVSKLKSSQNDAKELSFLLQRIGFIIDQPQLDKKLAQMKHILVDFENSIQSNDIVLFYFAGHGTQWKDQNYLMLKDFSAVNTADSKAAAEFLKMNAINAHDILNALSARKPYAIIFLLDCCKNYSLKDLNLDKRALNGSDSKLVGLTGMHKTGSLIAFACAPVVSIIPINAQWSQNGVTVAGGHGRGDDTNQLNRPWGLFVDDDGTMFITDWYNERIIQWKMGDKNGQVVAGGHSQGNLLNQLYEPTDVLIDRQTDSLIICNKENRRVIRWPCRSGTTQGEILCDNIKCWGLVMDDQRYLYISDEEKHEVRRYRIGDKNGTVVVGGHGEGDKLNQLCGPSYIFVDRKQAVYVSDNWNHRVMKWNKGAKEGIVVAGGQGEGNALTQLSYPKGLFVDTWGTIYVVDAGNDRVMRWPKGAKEGTVLVGGNGKGQEANQLSAPMGLSLDRHGNLYVVDQQNHRVQQFSIKQTHCDA
ncbi:unnamed protein product [Rotaria sp. Silwood1]|nr:unnamed protein product [Rotaria sp. Silwood1]